jgi:hypothetical protein
MCKGMPVQGYCQTIHTFPLIFVRSFITLECSEEKIMSFPVLFTLNTQMIEIPFSSGEIDAEIIRRW